MTSDYEAITAHEHAVGQVIPLLEAIRSVAEIAFRRAEERLSPLARYAARIDDQLADLQGLPGGQLSSPVGLPQRSVLVVISSERGLCGAFNQRLIARARAELRSRRAAGEEVDLVCLGRQGQRLLETAGEPIVHSAPMSSFALPAYLDIEKTAIDLLDLMEARNYGALIVMHNGSLRRFQYQVITRQLFPIERAPPGAARPASATPVQPPDDAQNLFTQLITERVLIDLYQAVIESAISEELARVAAMRLATDNARHLLDQLTLDANRARQVSETNALLEIINGFQTASPYEGA